MKCDDCQSLMDEHLTGLLDEHAASVINMHTAECAECAQAFAGMKEEQEFYAPFRLEVTPALWAAVRTRIREEQFVTVQSGSSWLTTQRWKETFFPARLIPARALLWGLLAVGIIALYIIIGSRGPQPPATGDSVAANASAPVVTPAQSMSVKADPSVSAVSNGEQAKHNPGLRRVSSVKETKLTIRVKARAGESQESSDLHVSRAVAAEPLPDKLVRDAEQTYLDAITIASRDASRRTVRLTPEESARYKEAMKVIDTAIVDTRRAVREQPDDLAAVQYMLSSYAKKVEILIEMAGQ